jgi:hypothetical protein
LDRTQITGWTADPDLDGINNLLEYFHGSDPSSAMQSTHGLKIDRDTTDGDAKWKITFSKVAELPGIEWSIEHSTDLQSWATITAPAPAASESHHHYSWIESASGAARFFRLKLTAKE